MTTKKYVTGFLFSSDLQHVVLIEKLNPSWQRGLLNGVGGKVEAGETALQAMVREFAEETGVKTCATDWRLFSNVYRQGYYDVDMFVACSDLAYSARTVEQEQVHLVAREPLPKNIIPNLAWLIPLALDKQIDPTVPVCIQETAAERISA